MGFAGMVVGVPLFAVLYSMLTEKINHLLKSAVCPWIRTTIAGISASTRRHAFVEAQETMPPVSAKSAAVRHSRKIRKTKTNMRKEGHCEAAVFLFCVLVQNGRVSLAKRGNLAYRQGHKRVDICVDAGRTRG